MTLEIEYSESDKELEERMKAAGMRTIPEMLESTTLGKFSCHAGVIDLDAFERWLIMQRKEYMGMQARMMLDKKEEDDLFEWVLAHNALFGEVLANFRQATGRKP